MQVLLALLLAATALGKLLDMPGFVAVLATYRALAPGLEWPVAVFVVVAEVVLVVLFLARFWEAATALACALLHVAYAAWAAIALVRGIDVPNCGCFGVFLARPLTVSTVVEDTAVTCFSLVLWRLLENRSPGRLPAAVQLGG